MIMDAGLLTVTSVRGNNNQHAGSESAFSAGLLRIAEAGIEKSKLTLSALRFRLRRREPAEIKVAGSCSTRGKLNWTCGFELALDFPAWKRKRLRLKGKEGGKKQLPFYGSPLNYLMNSSA